MFGGLDTILLMLFKRFTISMQRVSFLLLYSCIFFLATSCLPYKVKTEDFFAKQEKKGEEQSLELLNAAHSHYLYHLVPRHRSQVYWYDVPHWMTWAMFGNDDDGIFGEESTAKYETKRKIGILRALFWSIRNPLHNFSFYVIGSAYVENSEVVLFSYSESNWSMFSYSPKGGTVFAGERTSFFLGLHGWKPFVSLRLCYRRCFEFYLGWRSRGNFGIKLIPAKKMKRGKGKSY